MRLSLLPLTAILALGCRGETLGLDSDTGPGTDPGTEIPVAPTLLTGDVSLPDGEPATGAIVTVQDQSAVSGADGSFLFDDLLPGAATVSATLDGHTAARADVVIVDGESTSVSLTLGALEEPAPLVTALSGVPLPVPRAGTAELLATVSTEDALTWEWQTTGDFVVLDDGEGTATLTAPDVPSAEGEVTATATNADGISETATLLVNTEANEPPVISSLLASPPAVAPSGTVTVSAVVSDADDSDLTYDWTPPDGWQGSPASDVLTLTAPDLYGQAGEVSLVVTDPWGGSVTRTVSVATVSNAAPIIEAVSALPNPVEPGGTVQLAVQASDANGDDFTVAWTIDDTWGGDQSGSSATLLAPDLRGVSTTVNVVVTDAAGASAFAGVDVSTVGNLSPVIASVIATPSAIEPGESVEIAVSASDPNGDELTVQWVVPGDWTADVDDGTTLSLTAPATETTGLIDVVVSDAYGGSATGSVSIDVRSLNTTPSVMLPDVGVFRFGEERLVTAVVTDEDGDELDISWQIVGDGWRAQGTGPVVQLTAPVPDGAYGSEAVLIVSVTDGVATSSATATVSVGADGTSCQDLAEQGASSGAYWLDPDGSGSSVYATACDMDGDGNAWTLLYKRSADVVAGDLEAEFVAGDLNAFDLSLADRDQEDMDFAVRDLARRFAAGTEARVEIVTGGAVQQWMTYDTSGASAATFYAKERLLASSWENMVPEHVGAAEYWSISGDEGSKRRWYINRQWGGCPNDEGWLIVQGDSEGACPFDVPNQILYSTADGVTNLTTGDVANADAMLVWVRQAAVGVTRADVVQTCSDLPDSVTEDTTWWVDPDGPGGSAPFRTLCDVENGGWTMAYKKSTGVQNDPLTVWTGGDTNTSDPDALDRDGHVGDYANSAITTGFSAFSEARVEVLVDGAPVHSMTFTLDAGNPGWFSQPALTSSTWTDLAAAELNYFGIVGHNELRRRLFVNHNYGGCGADVGWLIANGASPVCSWETPYAVKYAVPDSRQNWTTGDIGVADAMAVFLR